MKFSYTLIKQLVPGVKSKAKLIDGLNMKAFEAEDLKGDAFDLSISHNRYSDASSHWGIAREAAAILNLKPKIEDRRIINIPQNHGAVKVKIDDYNLCPRYSARYLEFKKLKASPAGIKKVLRSCGLRPISGIVDIMNYVMLETGQPLHAFDADKVEGAIMVRAAKPEEKFTTLDSAHFTLDRNDIVISDKKGALALAGIKGGKKAEIDRNTKRIIVESANFNQVNIYKTMKKLQLITDASIKFSHGLNPRLVEIGMDRATLLLNKLLGAKLIDSADVYKKLPGKKIIEFDVARSNRIIGAELDIKTVIKYLTALGFIIKDQKVKNGKFLVEVPPLRDDINIFEDIVEEVARLYGLNELKSIPPVVGLYPAETQYEIILKDNIRPVLVGFGFSEVYNYSLVGENEGGIIELENPISKDKKYLRGGLLAGLRENLRENSKYFDTIRIFEIGRIFLSRKEKTYLGIAIQSADNPFLELKGVVNELLKRIGLVDFFTKQEGEKRIRIESDHNVLGYIESIKKETAVAEINLNDLLQLTSEEHEYRPLSKYPSIVRDVSIAVGNRTKVGDILEDINNLPLEHVQDVDLIDYYEGVDGDTSKIGLTFRIILRSDNKTLTDKEADKDLKKIESALVRNLKAKIR